MSSCRFWRCLPNFLDAETYVRVPASCRLFISTKWLSELQLKDVRDVHDEQEVEEMRSRGAGGAPAIERKRGLEQAHASDGKERGKRVDLVRRDPLRPSAARALPGWDKGAGRNGLDWGWEISRERVKGDVQGN